VPEADAVVAAGTGVVAAVLTADCAPLALGTADGVFAAVHVGWRGLVAGVVEAATAAVRAASDQAIVGVVGPAIGPCCYEFGPDDLDAVLGRTGGVGRAATTWGALALDLPGAVAAVAAANGIALAGGAPPCTACDGRFFSHRAQQATERQATFVWQVP
jgi:copper oxidase (laccase) domain-containing protein